jgi:hypothetical protein
VVTKAEITVREGSENQSRVDFVKGYDTFLPIESALNDLGEDRVQLVGLCKEDRDYASNILSAIDRGGREAPWEGAPWFDWV